MITLKIPCKRHVKKYLIKKYGDTHVISPGTMLGIFAIQMLNKEFDPKELSKVYSDFYELELTEFYIKTKGFNICPEKLFLIGESLDRLFREELFAHVDLVYDRGDKWALRSIRHFLRFYEITEDELKLESIYKAYLRRKKQEFNGQKKQTSGNP